MKTLTAILSLACCLLLATLSRAADVSVTAANVAKGAGASTERGTAGATITAGQPLYKDSTDSDKLKPADANAASVTAYCVGIALHASLSGQPIEYLTAGEITIGGTVAVGTIYVVSGTAGGIAPSTDLVSGWYTTVIGVATTTGKIQVALNRSGVAVP